MKDNPEAGDLNLSENKQKSEEPVEKSALGNRESSNPAIAQCKLYQNAPNPFSQNTEIRFYIPETIQAAQLCVYNLQGKLIKQIKIAQRGDGMQQISGSELAAGMYLYALIVDGQEVDVKRMILTR